MKHNSREYSTHAKAAVRIFGNQWFVRFTQFQFGLKLIGNFMLTNKSKSQTKPMLFRFGRDFREESNNFIKNFHFLKAEMVEVSHLMKHRWRQTWLVEKWTLSIFSALSLTLNVSHMLVFSTAREDRTETNSCYQTIIKKKLKTAWASSIDFSKLFSKWSVIHKH